MPNTGELRCLEMKMIGKPYAGKPPVRFDEGEQDFVLWEILNGHEAGNGRNSQGRPTAHRDLLYSERIRCSWLIGTAGVEDVRVLKGDLGPIARPHGVRSGGPKPGSVGQRLGAGTVGIHQPNVMVRNE